MLLSFPIFSPFPLQNIGRVDVTAEVPVATETTNLKPNLYGTYLLPPRFIAFPTLDQVIDRCLVGLDA